MGKVVADMERICRLRSRRDELVLSAMRAREKGYSHTADALDKILLDEFDFMSLDTQAIGNSIGLNSQD